MPTAVELDQVSDRHPILVKRGGHNDVVNSFALRLAGITEDTPAPAGGVIGRDEHGRLTGRLIDTAMALVERLLPPLDQDRRIDGLRSASQDYCATGIGTVRDAMEHWRYRADPWLRVWGVKFGLDGGLEAGAAELPYRDQDDFYGTLIWEPDALVLAVERVVRRGWRVGTHAYDDRAVRTLLGVYTEVLHRNPGLPAGMLVMEHGGLAGAEQRARAAALGVPVTIQQPLLHDTAEVGLGYWGPQRVADLFPAREWIDQGVLVAAGSDFPVGQFGAMRSVWGMVTRNTVAGVQGQEHAITVPEAIALHTTQAARLLGEDALRGCLTPGRLADLTIWPVDPTSCDIDRLRDLTPDYTILGSRTVHGPAGHETARDPGTD